MTNRDTARYEAGKRIQNFNATHATTLATIADYALELTDFNDVLTKLDAAVATQNQDNSGAATNKSQVRLAMAATLVIYCKRALVKAHRAGNTVLEQGLDHAESYYLEGNATQALARATAIKDLLKNNLATVTNIAPADIAAIEAAITAFEAAKDAPTLANQTQKIHGTNQIDALLDKMDIFIDNMGNLVDSYFAATPLADEFDLNSKLIILGTRSNTVTLHITDAATAAPIVDATATNATATKTAHSNAAGTAIINNVRTGTQTFTIAATGYAPQTVAVKVVRGGNTDVVVGMVK